ncbi:hypothetical protein KI387_017042 [Taxus chinensis]|uniref:Protein kinase domain-containing protein n=1 Tax=Taxus chinensis TaxID=29808 RepID=A0AA38GIF2_TAXCH|nr:hypothetical protein KI387_017042 [Taxus chinensis]
MDGSQELNWEQSGQREIFISGESSINNDMSKDASNTGYSQTDQEEKHDACPCGNPQNKQHPCAFQTPTTVQPCMDDLEEEDISLREWLNVPNRAVDRLECLHIFKQILEIVSLAHSEGVVLQNIRPSCFMLSSFNRVSFIESASCTSSGSDSSEDSTLRLPQTLPGQASEDNLGHISIAKVNHSASAHMAGHQSRGRSISPTGAGSQELSLRDANTNISSVSGRSNTSGARLVTPPDIMGSDAGERINQENMDSINEDENVEDRSNHFPLKQILLMELNWYTSPEELAGGSISFSSDIYCLGVLFIELFCPFSSETEQRKIMPALRYRVLPPQLLCKWPKEAFFCLWLLHPVPASRPKLSEVLKNEIISEAKEALEERQAAVKLKGKIADTELLLDFLRQVQSHKQERADKLCDAVTCLTSDIKDVLRQQAILQHKANLIRSVNQVSTNTTTSIPTGKGTMLGKHLRQDTKNHNVTGERKLGKSDVKMDREGGLLSRSARLMKNFKKLEQVYFSTRCKAKQFKGDSAGRLSGASSIGWGSIAGTDAYNLWDVTKSQSIVDFPEHEKRVWSVDFSQSDPTRLASGGDDGMVKLWSTNQEKSIGTIRTKANVCCVQFAPDSGRLIALGSADYKIYCYDLRSIKVPWCILGSHNKTVSYVKFLDSDSLVSASTDNTLKLWDLATNKARLLGSPVRTFMGHTNVKNFVGLSVSDGYIATGSETNEVLVYHKSLPMPVASYKFNSADPITGLEMEDDDAQFVSCVCWKGQTQTLAAANSTGNIRLLEMI